MHDRILVPTDGSERFGRVAEEAADLAELAGATVHALYVVDAQAYDYNTSPAARQAAQEQLRSSGEAATETVTELAASRGVTAEGEVRHGTPHTEILDYADEIAADLIVMGTHGRTGLNRVLLGSVAERVIRLSDRPVLTVDLSDGKMAIESGDAAVEAATEALQAEGYELDELRDEPYREASTWVVPTRTAGGDRFNVHVNATTGESRIAQVG